MQADSTYFKNFLGGHAPDPLDLACYAYQLLTTPEILIFWFSPPSTYFLNVSLAREEKYQKRGHDRTYIISLTGHKYYHL